MPVDHRPSDREAPEDGDERDDRAEPAAVGELKQLLESREASRPVGDSAGREARYRRRLQRRPIGDARPGRDAATGCGATALVTAADRRLRTTRVDAMAGMVGVRPTMRWVRYPSAGSFEQSKLR